MRLVVCGSDAFAVPSLRAALGAGHQVAAVVTAPDRPGDRGRAAPRPLRDEARARGISVLQPPRLGAPEAVAAVRVLGGEALVVASYGQRVPPALLGGPEGPRYGGLGVHPSLLPRHRGASPIQAAILAGDAETGVSLMRMEAGLDTGPVLGQVRVPMAATVTAPALRASLAEVGAALLVDVLDRLRRGTAVAIPQDGAMATSSPVLRRQDGALDWARDATAIDRHLRALQPWPQVTVPLGGRRVRLLAGRPVPLPAGGAAAAPGTVLGIDGEAVLVRTGDAAFRCERVQPPSGRPMAAAAYLRGRRPPPVPPGAA